MTDQANTTAADSVYAAPADGEAEIWFAPETSTFGDRLAGAREAASMSQSQLARRLGVKVSTIRNWEDDLSEPRANKLQLLSGLLNVSLTWLLTAEGEGLEAPAPESPMSEDLSAVLTEMRQLRGDIVRTSERLAILEKRLRRSLQEI